MDTRQKYEQIVRESAPLAERLDDCRKRIGNMCSEGRPPKMTIPTNWNDDDFFICTTLQEAKDEIDRLRNRG